MVISFFILALVAGCSLWNSAETPQLIRYSSYYFMWALVLTWIYQVFAYLKSLSFEPLPFLRQHRVGLLLTFAVSIGIFLTTNPQLRVLSDETNLLGVSKSMAFQKTVDNPIMGLWYYDNYWTLEAALDKRPFLFPFLVSILHSALGFNYHHVFWINFIALFAFLFSVFRIAEKFTHQKLVGCAGVFLIVAQPLILLTATSGGFDFFSAAILLMVFTTLYLFLKHPNVNTLALLWVHLLAFLNVRYESILLAFIIGTSLIVLKQIKWAYLEERFWLYTLSPWLLLPRVWQTFLKWDAQQTPPGVSAFSFQHLSDHIQKFILNFAHFDFYFPYATLVNLVSLALLFHLFWLITRNKIKFSPVGRRFAAIAGIGLASTFILNLSYHAGEFNHPTRGRYFILPMLYFSLVPLLYYIKVKTFRASSLLAFAIVSFIH
jgi:hypothetical protein